MMVDHEDGPLPAHAHIGRCGPVVLDLQALQSPHHGDRGIGRWALDFAQALCRRHPGLVGAVLLNPDLPAPADLGSLAATGKVGTGKVAGAAAGGAAAGGGLPRVGATRIYHVLSPFEPEEGVERLWPAWAAGSGVALVVTLYDLIPAVFPARYLADAGVRRRYRTRLELVRAAHAVLAISEATRTDALQLLGLHPGRVTTVGTGISGGFSPPPSVAPALDAARRAVPGLERSFLLCVGGEDERKNLEGLMAGYAALDGDLRSRHQLVVVCKLTDGYRAHLRAIATRLGIRDRLLLTGYVSEQTLVALYQSTMLFVFPSLYEGYGLPVAEAMACGAIAVASGSSAMAEVADPAGHFDPTDPGSIAATITRALTDPRTRSALRAATARPAPTWDAVVDRAAEVYRHLLRGRSPGEGPAQPNGGNAA